MVDINPSWTLATYFKQCIVSHALHEPHPRETLYIVYHIPFIRVAEAAFCSNHSDDNTYCVNVENCISYMMQFECLHRK